MFQVNQPLLELFRSHGVDATTQGEWIVFPTSNVKANASIAREIPQQTGMSVQLDVQFEIALGRDLFESVGGIGETREAAISDAFQNFAINSFHVLLAAFFQSGDDQVSREKWNIGGKTREVIVGSAGVRGKVPVQTAQLAACLEQLPQWIARKSLNPEPHWVRLYYGQMQGESLACELLLDNEVWEEMQSEMARLDWPFEEEFYSVRVFLVIAGETDHGITPESTVMHLAEILAANPKLTEDEICQALVDTGMPDDLATRAYRFIQIAWGRLLLDHMKINLSADYLRFDANGRVAESGQLVDEPYFAAASRLGPRYMSHSGFQQVALASAEVNAVDKASHAGHVLENLVMAPVIMFTEEPTAAGMQNVQKVISQHIAAVREQTVPKEKAPTVPSTPAWWQFWKR